MLTTAPLVKIIIAIGIDFRKLNEKMYQDSCSLPVIWYDILDHSEKATFFSAFDLSVGFHQIEMHNEAKKYTAFSTSEGHLEYVHMLSGLKSSPATFTKITTLQPDKCEFLRSGL